MNVMKRSDPDPEEKKRTNADEQDVVVNTSTRDHGYDEPARPDKGSSSTEKEQTNDEVREERNPSKVTDSESPQK